MEPFRQIGNDDLMVCVNIFRVKRNYGSNKEDSSRFDLNHVASIHENEPQSNENRLSKTKKSIQSDDDNTFKSNFNGRNQ